MTDQEGPFCDTGPTSRQRYTEALHSTVRALPAAFDTKAVFFAGIVGACLAWQVNTLRQEKFIFFPLINDPPHWSLYAYFLLSIISLGAAYFVIFARTRGDKKILFSFVSLTSRGSAEKVVQEVNDYSDRQMDEAALRHSYELSVLCEAKAQWLKLAIWSGLLAIILLIVSQFVVLPSAG